MTQNTLLKLSSDPDFILAKSLIVQGLAIKLGGEDAVSSEDLKLTLKRRESIRMRLDREEAQNAQDEANSMSQKIES